MHIFVSKRKIPLIKSKTFLFPKHREGINLANYDSIFRRRLIRQDRSENRKTGARNEAQSQLDGHYVLWENPHLISIKRAWFMTYRSEKWLNFRMINLWLWSVEHAAHYSLCFMNTSQIIDFDELTRNNFSFANCDDCLQLVTD